MILDTLRDLWERNARLHPDGVALVGDGVRRTHGELLERGTRLANALALHGVDPGDRVALLSMNRVEYPEILVANHLLGSIANTLNFRLAPPEIEWIMETSTPRLLIFEAQYRAAVEEMRARLPSIAHFVEVGASEDPPDWAEDYETLVASASDEAIAFRPRSHDIAHLIYTSGTTGRPKGVMRSHRAEVFQAESMACGMDVRPDSRILEVMPFFHVGAQASAWAVWWRAGTVYIEPSFDAERLLTLTSSEGITHLHLVPLMVQELLDVPDGERFDLRTLETLLYAAAPITPAVLRRAIERFGRVFVGMWGMTEGSGTLLPKGVHRPDGSPEDVALLASVGQEQHRSRIRIVDGQGHDCAVGESGELWLQSDMLMSGYWNDTAATVDALRGGWFRTGDMGYFDAQRNVFLVDRKKDMIISGGENVYSQEVERALAEHPAVDQVAVIGVPDERWGEAVKAIVVPRSGERPSGEELIDHCVERIARYKKPRSIEFVEALPVLASGKVDKVALREKFGGSAENVLS